MPPWRPYDKAARMVSSYVVRGGITGDFVPELPCPTLGDHVILAIRGRIAVHGGI
jgi:hypothetical protein